MHDYAHTEEFEGFTISLELLPEYESPDWDFESEEDRLETLRKIDDGVWLWFVAKVTASREGIVLGTDYLGGCCYASVAEFIAPGAYFDAMRRTAIDEARATLAKLCNP